MIGGKRVRFSTDTSDWEAAVTARDLFEARKGITSALQVILERAPRFRDFVPRYIETTPVTTTASDPYGSNPAAGGCLT